MYHKILSSIFLISSLACSMLFSGCQSVTESTIAEAATISASEQAVDDSSQLTSGEEEMFYAIEREKSGYNKNTLIHVFCSNKLKEKSLEEKGEPTLFSKADLEEEENQEIEEIQIAESVTATQPETESETESVTEPATEAVEETATQPETVVEETQAETTQAETAQAATSYSFDSPEYSAAVLEEMANRPGMLGRLIFPEVGIDVALFLENGVPGLDGQQVVDREDSAIWQPFGNGVIGGDHSTQGFSAIENLHVGSLCYINKGTYIETWQCTRTCRGKNIRSDLVTDAGESVKAMDYELCWYTCSGGNSSVFMSFWTRIN